MAFLCHNLLSEISFVGNSIRRIASRNTLKTRKKIKTTRFAREHRGHSAGNPQPKKVQKCLVPCALCKIIGACSSIPIVVIFRNRHRKRGFQTTEDTEKTE